MKKRQLKKYLAPKKRDTQEMYSIGKIFINTYLSEREKEKWLKNLEIIHLLGEGIYILELKVEFLATGKYNSEQSQEDNNKKAIELFQTIVEIRSTDAELYKILDLALKIVNEQEDKEEALENLNKIRDVYLRFLSDFDKFLVRLPNFPPRRKKYS